MDISRREFLMAGAAAGLAMAASGCGQHTRDVGMAEGEMRGEDGSKLWLRYAGMAEAAREISRVVVHGDSATARVIREEFERAMPGKVAAAGAAVGSDTVVVGTPENSPTIGELRLEDELGKLGTEGFLIRTLLPHSAVQIPGGSHPSSSVMTVIASAGEIGALYGAFHFLRMLQTGIPQIGLLNIAQKPRLQLRLVNHWDNADGTIERGYAGKSLWKWDELPGKLSPRYVDYARAQASIGINGAVLNNVNADVRFLTSEYLKKAAALADLWRPYGIRVYLAVNFAAPVTLGKLATADPFANEVMQWWKDKASEIYTLIPDFGGFLVKANSEGQPGPMDYKRTHAEGANAMAEALAGYGGNVIWRAFVYDQDVDPDRAKRAYIEFVALEGQFRPNVLIQVKNGPIDFQPREPFHPLFGALKQTPVLGEIQATQEYLGQAKHLVYLGTMWKEFLDAETFAKGETGATVGNVIEGKVHPYAVTGMATVLNCGSDANWCGHDFSQANWYAAGRLAWDHTLSAEAIAEEWVRQTFSREDAVVKTIVDMMMASREVFVNYTMPLGLHHLIGGDHYAPMPWNGDAPRPDWTAVYYHHAGPDGIGFDRTRAGDKAVEQYFPPVRDVFDDVEKCPEKFLLWFHRLPWDYKVKSGRTLWEELCLRYQAGARDAAGFAETWESLRGKIDAGRHAAVANRLAIQTADSAAWRDAILAYFSKASGKGIVRG